MRVLYVEHAEKDLSPILYRQRIVMFDLTLLGRQREKIRKHRLRQSNHEHVCVIHITVPSHNGCGTLLFDYMGSDVGVRGKCKYKSDKYMSSSRSVSSETENELSVWLFWLA